VKTIRIICVWVIGRSYPGPREREGDACASPAGKGKVASMV